MSPVAPDSSVLPLHATAATMHITSNNTLRITYKDSIADNEECPKNYFVMPWVCRPSVIWDGSVISLDIIQW